MPRLSRAIRNARTRVAMTVFAGLMRCVLYHIVKAQSQRPAGVDVLPPDSEPVKWLAHHLPGCQKPGSWSFSWHHDDEH
jgi:hypothetical protein